jgi:CPA1 family monovalent cation:H+ antiporter
MSPFEIFSVLIALAALFSYLNYRYLRLPSAIGIMLLALIASLVLVAAGTVLGFSRSRFGAVIAEVAFDQLLLHGMLGFLLFAGALHINLDDLAEEWGAISVLAILATAISTFLIGILIWLVLTAIGMAVPLVQCLLFGALISPTDPVAVLGIMKKAGASRTLQIQVAGESLFNDGVGVALFLILLELMAGTRTFSASAVAAIVAKEVIGGCVVGLLAGALIYMLMKRIDNYQVEVLLTLALAMAGYALAERLHVSAPIAIVAAGLLIGNPGRKFAMSAKTQDRLDTFWELIDETLNAFLFMFLGLAMLIMPFAHRYLWVGALAVVIVLLVRWLCVGAFVGIMRLYRRLDKGAVSVLTWGGLRGGISVAMALTLPVNDHRDLFVTVTYCVVCFSILVQGMTMPALLRQIRN